MDRPLAAVATHDQVAYRGGRLRPGPLARATASGSRMQAWLPPTGRPPVGIGSTRRGDTRAPIAGCRSRATAPSGGAVGDGAQLYRQHKGDDGC
ncbi:hypothetical protein BHE74_00058366 [Ensete ventricosum]|nr:hypothetical protein BHE74_00058366 [Ensete ventricosum]